MCDGNLRPRELTRHKDFVYETHEIFSDPINGQLNINGSTKNLLNIMTHDRFQLKEPPGFGVYTTGKPD